MTLLVRFFLIIVLSFISIDSTSQQIETPKYFTVTSTGKWLIEKDGSYMSDPQTSGLTYAKGYLYSVSDASAKSHQLRKLHKISIGNSKVIEKLGPIQLSKNIANNSCFVNYLQNRPDYEGLITVPNSNNEWLLVTEDASRGNTISAACLTKYADASFTNYPSLLIKLQLVNDELLLTGVRVLRFQADENVDKRLGKSKSIENDGIEGITITRDGKILLGLEKDANGKPRVFELAYDSEMFDVVDSFIDVNDSGLLFPDFLTHKSPINGMDIYYPNAESEGFLITAARNVNQLWILDLAKKTPPRVVDLDLYAPSDTSKGCANIHKVLVNALEGVAVHNQTLFLVNDPWKEHYYKNAVCSQDKEKYSGFSPILFTLPIDSAWFK